MIVPGVLSFSHALVRQAVDEGGIAIDATAGNGHDTQFLAECVGPAGKVYAFDIQQEALARTKQRLNEQGIANRVALIHAGHHEMDRHLPEEIRGKLQAVMFNLGYLPHGDPTIITRPETTLPALKTSAVWLAPGGVLSVVLYTGHPGGQEEAEHVLQWAQSLSSQTFQVMHYRLLNRKQAPSLVLVEKRKSAA
ncbi:class I SAM-dependent methyltransferase [Polycladomyces subterraneus]|uniref:Methyltransferase domain-containing protein n=1 Tax=Polycladomyces subterraneus TaxID=1016997 RepID=A0ABT8IMQ0_9BACL|nr:class I SAM-dependent methyltransferase [Polycladomyces subterraneus]MDN4594027.1 methyltransferase domain-containing protein [Polycladomyces subterraneus]